MSDRNWRDDLRCLQRSCQRNHRGPASSRQRDVRYSEAMSSEDQSSPRRCEFWHVRVPMRSIMCISPSFLILPSSRESQGRIAEALAKTVKKHHGLLTVDDLAAYRAIVKPAVVGSYRNRTIYTTHAPSSGAILISLLNTLEPLTSFIDEGRTPLNVHRFIEAQKFAFAHRTEFGDPAFVQNGEKWKKITRKDFARETLTKIKDVRLRFSCLAWY